MGVFARTFERLKWPDGTQFADQWMTEDLIAGADHLYDQVFPLPDKVPLVHGEPLESAKDCMQRMEETASTTVLATVYVAAWRITWAQSLVNLVVRAYPRCSMLSLFALKGGPATDMEIEFIKTFLDEAGFKNTVNESEDGEVKLWVWTINRDPKDKYNNFCVQLRQYRTVDDFSARQFADYIIPIQDNSMAPNLCQVAVVSSPVSPEHAEICPQCSGKPRIDEPLNAKLVKALSTMKEIAAELGWRTYGGEDNGEQWKEQMTAKIGA
jgi:hypothetical protein